MNRTETGGAKRAVMFGAGNIGRGFIAQLFCGWGFHTTFVDIDPMLVAQINQRREYPICLLRGEAEETYIVYNVCAVDGRNRAAAAEAIAAADFMAVSVGSRALPVVMRTLADGVILRCGRGAPPLNILICENLMNAQAYLRGLLLPMLPPDAAAYFEKNIGLVETSIGRMIPAATPERKAQDPLQIWAESYCVLPADKDAFKGGVPDYPYLRPYTPFSFYIKRKMLIHNMGRSAAAYLGYEKGYTYIWEAVGDAAVREIVQEAMAESAQALAKAYGEDANALRAYAGDLLIRFANRKLADTVARVGRDLPRKLGGNERLFAAARLCGEQNVSDAYIRRAIRAALFFQEDSSALTLAQLRAMADVVTGETKDAAVSNSL